MTLTRRFRPLFAAMALLLAGTACADQGLPTELASADLQTPAEAPSFSASATSFQTGATVQFASGQGAVGTRDAATQLDGVGAAYIIARHPAWMAPATGTNWVSRYPYGASDGSVGGGNARFTVTIPANATVTAASVQSAVDNSGMLFLNGTSLGATGTHVGAVNHSVTAAQFQSGANEFRLAYYNAGGPEGLYYQGSVTFQCNTGYAYQGPNCRVTYASVCALVRDITTDADVAQGLCDKLAAMGSAAGRGNQKAKEGPRGAFQNQVRAQTGKSITEANAERLLALVAQL